MIIDDLQQQTYKPLTREYVMSRLRVFAIKGRCYWLDPTKYHPSLAGKEAGTPRKSLHNGKSYLVISLDGIQYKRAYIVFLMAFGYWPSMVDHRDGNSLNDRCSNLREATVTQNNWNHRTRRKRAATPMGVRLMSSGRFQARIACNKKTIYKTFATANAAQEFYVSTRRELFGDYSGS